MTTGKKFYSVSTKDLRNELKKYIDLAVKGHTVYIIRRSIIVAELKPAEYKEIVK